MIFDQSSSDILCLTGRFPVACDMGNSNGSFLQEIDFFGHLMWLIEMSGACQLLEIGN